MRSRLVERDAETATLGRLLDRARGGHGDLVAFEAPPGMGKSRLLWHLRDAALRDGWRSLDVRATPMSPGIGYGVLRDWFGLMAHRHRSGEHPFDGPGAALVELADGASRPLGDLVYGVRWVLEDLCAERPLLLTVDDLQWVDSGSLKALDLLAPAVQQLPCVLAYTVRTGEEPSCPESLARLREVSRVLHPEPLSVDGVATLLEAHRLDPEQADRIHTVTGGVPLFVGEVIASGGDDVPDSLVGSITGRLRRLSATALTTASAVAILGDHAATGSVAELAGVPPATVVHDLALLTTAQLAHREDGTHRLRHPLVADAVLAALSADDTADLHARCADVLARRGAPRTVVARHLLHTTPGDDPDTRDRLAEQGRHALAAGEAEQAHRYFDRAIAEGPITAAEIPLLSSAASALSALGEIEAAQEMWRRARSLTEDPDELAALRAAAGDALLIAGEYAQARATFGSPLDASPDGSHAGHVLSGRMVFSGLLMGAPARDMHEQFDRLLGEPADAATPDHRLALAAAASLKVADGGTAAEARDLALRAIDRGALFEHANADGTAVFMASCSLIWASALDEAERALTTAMEEARARGSVLEFANAAACRGTARARMGLTAEAESDFAATLEQRSHGWNAGLGFVLAGLVECHIARGELERTLPWRSQLERIAGERTLIGAYAQHALGDIAAAHGDHETAARRYAEVGRQVHLSLDNPAVLPWRAGRALALIRTGNGREAVDLARENAARAEAFGAPYTLAQALRTVAAVDPTADRIGLLRRALAALESVPAGRLAAQVSADLAGMLILLEGAGASPEVVSLLRRAESYAQVRGLRPLEDRVRRLLDRIGEPANRPAAEALALLTPSERRVADLTATGLTNRQVAQELFVTVKAVEWHLSNVYRKLGIHSRAELPTLLAR
ncbi:helix-turn-helix transcriptional regulator [Nocardioides jiangxiensis]|uniref:AAA family ATPase n=1 Tax=Nocardioides jiangxiensis TaxID=3064524 RepID=A0ABT9AZR1_9ACTN|nr:LuxR family transcriptional regulator [Nocardioides sp. WY-20]MDO7868091.1 AAA family ATPase [Nocardioides sp. WY-20]